MNTLAETALGRVRGRVKEDVLLFAGIPFAAPPVGERRFAAPAPHPGWAGELDATRFGNAAPQLPGGGMTESPPKRMGEDCLFLNVTTPALDDARRPVLVWIHGGGFRNGQGAIPWYNGTRFAKRGDLVVVSINYRLGALGFTNLEGLGAGVESSGVAGLLDQIGALRWVRDHIAAFGGDPDQVTIAGESAGGMSVGSLLACPDAKGLFRRAIAQSGAAHHSLSREASRDVARRVCAHLGADLDALRAAPVERVLDAQALVEKEMAAEGGGDIASASGLPFQPTAGVPGLPTAPIEAIRAGASSSVDLLVGTNAHETTLFGYADVDEERALRLAGRHFDDAAGALAAYRRDHPGASARDAVIALTTDHVFRIPAIRLLEAHTRNGGRGYQYLFSWRSRAFGGRLGATHALEIPFAFDNLDRAGVDAFIGEGPRPQTLADAMHAAWIAFVRGGDPGAVDGAPGWPAFDEQRRAVMEFGDSVRLVDDPGANSRALWGGIR